MSKITWRFTLEPLLDGVECKQKYGYVVDNPKDALDVDDLMMQVGNDFGKAILAWQQEHLR